MEENRKVGIVDYESTQGYVRVSVGNNDVTEIIERSSFGNFTYLVKTSDGGLMRIFKPITVIYY